MINVLIGETWIPQCTLILSRGVFSVPIMSVNVFYIQFHVELDCNSNLKYFNHGEVCTSLCIGARAAVDWAAFR